MTDPDPTRTGYERFLEETVAAHYDTIVKTPWRLDRVDRAWRLKAARRGADEFGLPPERVYEDLRTVMKRRGRNPFWILRVLLTLPYVVFVAVRGLLVWRVYAWRLGARYVPAVSDSPPESHPRPGKPEPRRSPATASIVLLSHQRLPYLRTTIDSLFRTTDRDRFELIVVDNGSTDGSADYLRRLAAAGTIDKVILRRRNHGTSPGFNIGFAYADRGSRYLVKLDSDIVFLTEGWLERFERFLTAHPRVGTVAQTQINHALLRWAPRRRLGDEWVSSWNWFVCGGSCMTIPRRVFEDVGWLNEEFGVEYMPDDLDYAMRLSFLGYEAYYLQGCVTYHRADLDRRRYRMYGRGKIRQRRRTARQQEQEMYRRYASGEIDPRLRYERYEGCVFPGGGGILEVE